MAKMNKFNKKKKEEDILDYMDTIYDKNMREAVYGVNSSRNSILYNASNTDIGVPAREILESVRHIIKE
jgi:hypothetical protein